MFKFLKFKAESRVIFSFVFLAAVLLITLRGFAGNVYPNGTGKQKIEVNKPPFETSMERGRYAQTVSMSLLHTFNVDAFSSFLMPDLGWYSGHYYAAFPPGVAFLSVPLFLLGNLIDLNVPFAFLTTLIAAFLTAIVVYRLGRRVGLPMYPALFSAMVICLASGFLSYSVTVSAHPFSALIVSLMLFTAIGIRSGEKNFMRYALIWLLFSSNLFIDYPNLLICVPILFYALLKSVSIRTVKDSYKLSLKMDSIYGFIGLLPFIGIFVFYNLSHYQKPIAFTNQYNLKALEKLGVSYDSENLSNAMFAKKAYSNRFKLSKLSTGAHALLLSSDRGLFVYSPIFFLAVIGFFTGRKKRGAIFFAILLVVILNIGVYGSFDDPWGGWAFGPRYLIPSLPFLSILVGFGYQYLMKKDIVAKISIFILLFYSVAVALLGPLTTNAIPPEVEAKALGMSSNFAANLQYLVDGMSSSFFYSVFLGKVITPLWFYVALFVVIAIFFTALVLLHHNSNQKNV